MKKTLFFLFLYLCSCTTTPRCGDSIEARTIYIKKSSCEIRIRQVTIGSDLRIPESLKRPDLAGMELQWVEPGVIGGQVILGHFVIAPPSQIEGKTK